MATDEEILSIKIGADPKDAIKAVQKLEKAFSSRMKEVEKGTLGISKSIDKYISKLGDSKKAFNPVLKQQMKMYDQLSSEIDKASQEINNYVGEIKKLDGSIKALENRAGNASGNQLKAINEEISAVKKMRAEKQKALKDASSGKESREEARKKIEDIAKQAKSEVQIEPELLPAAMKEAGEVFVSPFKSFIKKDFSGALAGGKHLAKSGVALAGKGMQGTGLSKALAPIAQTLAKVGPMLGLMASSITGLVKLFIDAESAAKDYQKQILQTASTSGYLAKNMGDVGAATQALESDLRDLRGGAMDWSNVQWGISKETASAFQSALFAEGVALHDLGDEINRATGYAQSHAQVVQMSVAYSRAFGVSLNEITQLQGEMMTEMGMGLDGVQASFQAISEGADEAGITASKFFGMVRSFSSDLTLFTLRIQELTKVMGALGQAMSPREAQKFLQDMTGKFQGDLSGNLRATVIGGGKAVKGIAGADVESKMSAMMEEIRGSVGDGAASQLEAIMRDPKRDPRAIAQWQAQNQDKVSGDMMSSIHDATFVLDKIAKGGSINTAAILGSLSPLAKMDVVQQQSMRLIGKRVEDASGRDLLALVNAGIVDNVDQVRSFVKMQQGMFTKQEEILGRIASGQASDEELQRLSSAFGVQVENGEESAKSLRALMDGKGGQEKFWNSLEKSQQDLLKDGTEQIDYQKSTAKFQTSTMDQLSIIADILMNQLYDALTSIWHAITSLPGFGNEKEAFKSKAAKLQDSGAMSAISGAKGVYSARTAVVETTGKKVLSDIKEGIKQYHEVSDKLKSATGEEKKALEAKLNKLAPLLKFKDVTSQDLYSEKKHGMGGWKRVGIDPEETLDKLIPMAQAVKASGVSGAGRAGGGVPSSMAPPKEETQQKTAENLKKVDKTLKKGVSLAKPSQGYTQASTDSTLAAIRKGLFEYYLYSNMDPSRMLALSQQGIDPMSAIAALPQAAAGVGSVEGGLGQLLKPNARGGVVSGLVGNMAKVNSFPPAPAGEGWAAVRPGETISPGGKGGGGKNVVELRLKGDLGKFIDARVIDGTAEFQRNRRLR